MTANRWRLLSRGLVSLLVSFAVPALSSGNTASYTIIGSPAPAGPGFARITAEAQNGFTFDEPWGYLEKYTDEAAAEQILIDLQAQGWFVTRTGNEITITGHSGPPFSPIRKIDWDDGTDSLRTLLSADGIRDESLPPDKHYTFGCGLPNAHGSRPGSIVTRINSFTATAALSPGDTPAQAAGRVHSALTTAGFVVTLAGSTVTLDWDHPTNAALIGPTAHVEYELMSGASGPHLILGLPGTVIPASGWSGQVAVLTLTVLAGAGGYFLRRRRLAAA